MATPDYLPTRDEIADVLAQVYDGHPLADLREEHAAFHREAADAVLGALASRS